MKRNRRVAVTMACLGALSIAGPQAAKAQYYGSFGSSGGSYASHGSSGGSFGSSGGSYASHGSSGGSFGSSGGSYASHGSSGGSFGSSGGSYASHGSSGGSYGSHGSSGGSYGSYGSHGSYGGTYVSSIGTGAGTVIASAAPQATTGTLNVVVPADAKVYLKDQLMTLTGEQRRFVTPAIANGSEFVTTVKVEVVRDGKTLTKTSQARVKPGQETRVVVSFDTKDSSKALASR